MPAKGYNPEQIHMYYMNARMQQKSPMQMQQQQHIERKKLEIAHRLVARENYEFNMDQLIAMTYASVQELYKNECMSSQAINDQNVKRNKG